MQLNKVLKGLMLALPVIAVAACSSHKNNNNDQTNGMGLDGSANSGLNSGIMSSDEQARL
ncbi:peptidoglycan-associated outer membrane lipoprotein, partial [Erwinia amylovora]|nr:peptidoglycan-associated outer membrane lipoprotein [Erwinia amylovora]